MSVKEWTHKMWEPAPIRPSKKKITKIEECDKKGKFSRVSHELKYISEENSYKALVGCGGSNLNIHSALSWKKRRKSVKNKLFYTFFSLVCGQNCLVPFNQLWHLFGSSAHKKVWGHGKTMYFFFDCTTKVSCNDHALYSVSAWKLKSWNLNHKFEKVYFHR